MRLSKFAHFDVHANNSSALLLLHRLFLLCTHTEDPFTAVMQAWGRQGVSSVQSPLTQPQGNQTSKHGSTHQLSSADTTALRAADRAGTD